MAVTPTEIQSLNDLQYRLRFKIPLLIIVIFFLFIFSFLNFYPVGDKLKVLIKSQFKGAGCNPDFHEISMEWFLPKIVVTDLVVPASCLDRQGESLKFPHLTINYNIINFAPFGFPFKIDTEFNGQALSLYYVFGFNRQVVRLKDQPLNLTKLQPLLGENFKINGKMVVDLNLGLSKQAIDHLTFKAQSKDLIIPPQNIQGFTTPSMKINEFYVEAASENHPRVIVEKLIMGDTDSPIRANFKGRVDLQEGNVGLSPIDLTGEIAFSENFRQALPLIDMMFQSFTQKDGFYQVRLGGTLGAPKPATK